MIKNLQKTLLNDIDCSIHKDSCFHCIDTIQSSFLEHTPVYVSEVGTILYGVSLSVFNSLLQNGRSECISLVVEGNYNPQFDLYLQNITSNVVFQYHNISNMFSDEQIVECEFDKNQLDLMYSSDLDNVDTDIRLVSDETLRIKNNYNFNVVLKTLEHNFIVQKYFSTNKNEIDYQTFYRAVHKISNPLETSDMDDMFFKQKTYHEFCIKCSSMDELTDVMKHFHISIDKFKTNRVNFNTIKKYLV